MKAYLRNLMIGGLLALISVSANAQTVTWSFSGISFNALRDAFGTPLPSPPAPGVTGGIASGSMTFVDGDLDSFLITTNGGPFSHTYDSADLNPVYTYGPPDGGPVFGAWNFVQYGTLADSTYGQKWTLSIGFYDALDNAPLGGSIASTGIDLGLTGESFNLAGNSLDGYRRVNNGDDDPEYDVNATRIPEPASMALLGVALLGLGFASRRHRNSV